MPFPKNLASRYPRPYPRPMDDEALLRYSRQIMLPQVDAAGQERLLDAHALIIGAGGLGSPVAMYLAAAGIGHIALSDFDTVDLSNLQRQIVHDGNSLGRPKVDSAADRLRALNPGIEITAINEALQGDALAQRVAWADVVVDCSDNFGTRFALNEVCVEKGKPLVSGAVIRMEGQIATFLNHGDGPCYRCLYRDENELAETCTQTGVLAPLPGIVGSIQATEAMKVILGMETLEGRLLLLDAVPMEFRSIRLKKDPDCPVCGRKQSETGLSGTLSKRP